LQEFCIVGLTSVVNDLGTDVQSRVVPPPPPPFPLPLSPSESPLLHDRSENVIINKNNILGIKLKMLYYPPTLK
jgi:hypothetical protein